MNITGHSRYADIVNDGYISSLEKELLTYSGLQGKQNGLQNLPTTESEIRAYIMNTIESKIQFEIDRNHQINVPVSGVVVAQRLNTEAGKVIEVLKGDLASNEHIHQPLKEQKKQLTPDLQKRRMRRWVYAGAAVISMAEGFFAYEAFTAASFPRIPAFFAALGIAIGVGFGLHFLARYILQAETRIQRLCRYCIVLIPAFIGFFALGSLRAQSYNTHVDINPHATEVFVPSTSGVSGMSLTIISFLLFLIALLFSIRFYKTKEERMRDQEYDQVCGEIKRLSAAMQAIRDKIETIQKDASEKTAEALGRFEYALATEKRLKAIARRAVDAYIDANLRHRSDKSCPEFFSRPPAFNFKLFFDNMKTS